MTTRQPLTAGAPLALGCAAVIGAIQLGVGTLAEPASGMWPLVAGAVMVLGSLAVLVRPADDGEPFTAASVRILAVTGALALFIVLFDQVGFVLPSLMLLLFWLRWVSRERWLVTAAVAVTATGVLYGVFELALGVPFPYDVVTGR